MSDFTTVEVNHHGDFAPQPQCYYIGGQCNVIKDVDTDKLSFRDLEEWAAMFDYNPDSLVYFKTNGRDFANGTRLLYDDNSVRDMVIVCKPFGKIQVYVDSSFTDEALWGEKDDTCGDDIQDKGDQNLDTILKEYEEEFGYESDDLDDPAYRYESDQETEELKN